MTWLKIDEVARITGLTKRSIRYYEEIGLIYPPERSEGGIRLYTAEDVERLKKLVSAKEVLGFSLQELQKFIQVDEVIELYRQGYREAENEVEQINDLKLLYKSLNEQLKMIDFKIRKIEEFKKEIEGSILKIDKILEEKASISVE